MSTYSTKSTDIKREWVLVDASGQTLGRLASQIAHILRGKHKAIFSPHLDTGDFVVVINADKVRVTGRKLEDKRYYRHSGYPGGLKSVNLGQMMSRHPTRAIEMAVRGMLPRNRLGDAMARKLKVYAGPAHPHQAQVPKQISSEL